MQINIIKATCLSICLMLISCTTKPKKNIQKQLAGALVKEYVSDIESQFELKATSIKWGMYSGILDLIGPSFSTTEKLDIENARILIVTISNGLVRRVNELEKLRPYLKNYPFTSKNIETSISYRGPNPHQQKVKLVFLKNGTIIYESIDAESEKYMILLREDYDEACQKLNLEKQSQIQETF